MRVSNYICFISFLLIAGCANNENKFVGQWDYSEYSPTLFGLNFVIKKSSGDNSDVDIAITVTNSTSSKKRGAIGKFMLDRFDQQFIRIFTNGAQYGDLYFNKNSQKLELISNLRNYPMVEFSRVN